MLKLRRFVTSTALLAMLAVAVPTPAYASAPPDASEAVGSPFLNGIKPIISEQGFTHPGVFVSLPQLAYGRKQISARAEPHYSIYKQLASSSAVSRGTPDFTTFASASVYPSTNSTDYQNKRCSTSDSSGCMTYCGSYNNPNVGCDDLRKDAQAVYGQALMYYYSGDKTYAQRAVKILNAYAAHFKGNVGRNGYLVSAWTMEMMVRGAEILRYTYVPTGTDVKLNIRSFNTMLRLPQFGGALLTQDYGHYNGNWKLAAADGLINMAVFLNDRTIYDKALAMWRERVKSYIYIVEDGVTPVAPANAKGSYQTTTSLKCYWLANKTSGCTQMPQVSPNVVFQDGQSQEACRDFGHASLGFSSLIATAETAHHQGADLYTEHQKRIRKGVTYLAQVEMNYSRQGWPKGFCGEASGLTTSGLSTANFHSEVIYNALAVRNGVTIGRLAIPGYTDSYANNDVLAAYIAGRQSKTNVEGWISAWETLTHHRVGDGLPTT